MLDPEHLAGYSVVEKVVGAVLNTGDGETNNVLLDLLGYDGFPACFAMTKAAAGPNNHMEIVFPCEFVSFLVENNMCFCSCTFLCVRGEVCVFNGLPHHT